MADATFSLPAGLPADPALFSTLLDLLPLGVMYYTPVMDAAGTLTDLTLVYLNPAAQRMTQMPAQPGTTYRQQFPTTDANGAWDFHRRTWLSQEPGQFQFYYDVDGFDSYFRVTARRLGQGLLTIFTDTQDEVRSQAEQALLASQARERAALAEVEHERSLLQALLTQAPLVIGLYTGDDLHVVAASTLQAELVGSTVAQVVGRPLLEGAPELRGQGFDDLLRQVMATQVPFSGTEMRAVTQRAGQLHTGYYNSVYQPLYAADHQVLGVMSVAVEVTEQILARQQVEQLNAELEARVQERTQQLTTALAATERQRAYWADLFEQAPMAMTVLRGPALVVEMANAAVCRLWGRAPAQVLDRPLGEAAPENADQGFGHDQRLADVLRTGQPLVVTEAPAYLPQGPAGTPQLAYVNVSYHALREAADGMPRLIAYGTDVTEQVLARRAREAQQQLVHLVFEQAPLPIFVATGPTFILEVINAQAARLFHKTRAQLLGLPYAEAFPEFMQQGFGELLRDVWQSGQARTFTDVPVYFPNRPPQEPGYFTFVYQPLLDAQGQVHGIVCVGMEVTDQVLARQQVQRLNEELAALNEELTATNEELNASNTQLTRTNVDLDTFVYTASHDLKAPITNIESITLALRDTLPAEVQQDDMIGHLLALLEQTTTRFQTTIGQLTDLSKLQLAHAGPAEPVNLAAVVESVRLDLAPAITAADTRLTVEVAPELVVSFSPANLRSALYNLFSNAVKYRDPARPGQVLVRAYPADGRVVVEVQDNGLGLNAHQQSRLYGLFQRLHTHVEGTGVGLYTTKRLVENGGGTIAVHSQVDVGTTFTLTFPA